MSDNTGIEWADATWNVVIGCDKVSPGCDNCYAIRTATRMQANPNPKISTAYVGTAEAGEWTGQVNLLEDRLRLPFRWAAPRKIFVNAQSDLFHDDVPDEFIAKVWAVMAVANQHTFQILTKRHGRMRSLLNSEPFMVRVADAARDLQPGRLGIGWPLHNVWLGVSVENQQWADIRIPALLDTPAAVRWVSAEPLLGPVSLYIKYDDLPVHGGRLDWVVVGGESGPKARPMHPQWARTLREQCEAAGVPFLFKQWGEWAALKQVPYATDISGRETQTVVAGKTVYRVGKKAAGRELDGRTWDEYPKAVS